MLKSFSWLTKLILKGLKNNSVEKFIISLAIIFSVALVFTQIGMEINFFRPYLSDVEVFEGRHINEIDSLVKEGTITLKLIDMKKDKDIKILVNGEQVNYFYKKDVKVKVKDNSVVEIDGTKLESPIRVRVISKSNNIKSKIVNKQVKVESNIKIICRVNLK